LVLAGVAGSASVGDDCSSQVSKNPRACSLDGVDERSGEKEFADCIFGRFVVKEWEESPVDEPCSVGELCERVGEKFGVDRLLDFVNLFHR